MSDSAHRAPLSSHFFCGKSNNNTSLQKRSHRMRAREGREWIRAYVNWLVSSYTNYASHGKSQKRCRSDSHMQCGATISQDAHFTKIHHYSSSWSDREPSVCSCVDLRVSVACRCGVEEGKFLQLVATARLWGALRGLLINTPSASVRVWKYVVGPC